jgi:HEAT repeat protein
MKRAYWLLAGALACASLSTGKSAKSDGELGGGTAAVYGHVPPDQIEFLSTNDRILSVARSGTPTAIWEALEHGERVECMECIPQVAPLLYDASPVTREIAAWWLRRRIFGVFGAGEVYERTLQTLKSDPSPTRRAYAAQALGEFLAAPGIDACADAIANDKDAVVRAAAVSALGRLNSDGNGALSKALGDSDRSVKLAAVQSAGRVNSFNDIPPLVALTGDGDAVVRKRAIEVIGSHRAKDAASPLINLAQNDPNADVRGAACHALGLLGDASARGALETIAANDSNGFVRDLARISLRRL